MPVDNSFYALLRFNKLRLVQDLHSTARQSVSQSVQCVIADVHVAANVILFV